MQRGSYSNIDHGGSFREDDTRASAIVRASNALRHSVVSAVDSVGEKIQQGTVTGATLNTLCNVMGAGVLSLPFAMYNGSVIVSLVLLLYCSLASALSVYTLVCGCDATGKYAMNEVLAFALYPPLSVKDYIDELVNGGKREHTPRQQLEKGNELSEAEMIDYRADQSRRASRRKLIMVVVDIIIILNNYGALIVYARVIADSIPPVVADFLHGSGIWTSKITWLIISGVIFFILSCARHMEELKWASLMGFITILYIVIIIVVRYVTNQTHRFVPDTPEAHEVRWAHIAFSMLRTMATFGVAFGYQYNVPYFYQEIENHTPKKMMMTVLVAFPIITMSYGIVGVLGYMTFGALVADEEVGGDIVNNYPSNDVAVNIGRLGLFFHFVSVYPILSVCVRRGIHRLLCMYVPCAFLGVAPRRSKEVEESEKASLLASTTDVPAGVRNNSLPATPAAQLDDDDDDYAAAPLDDTPRRAIVAEALLIVATSAVVAGVAPGIGVVIEVMGSLFGIWIMMIGPGMVGIAVFSEKYRPQNTAYFSSNSFNNFSPHPRIYWVLSIVLTVSGIFFMVAGIIALVYGFAGGH